MSHLRRYSENHQLFFITCVTYDRRPILKTDVELLIESIKYVHTNHKTTVEAWVIIPDHFHLIVNVGDNDLSKIIHAIKQKFSALFRSKYHLKRGRLWQNRFWDHAIRDQGDMNRHIDYIHYNPVKHGLVESPHMYEFSSIGEDRYRDIYSEDWGKREPKGFEGEYGE